MEYGILTMNSSSVEINEALGSLVSALNENNKFEATRQLAILDSLGMSQTYASIAATYEFGSVHVSPRDDLAFEWYLKSASEQDDPESYLSIARFYFHGKHVDRNFEKFMKYCELAYEKGCHVAGINLATYYVSGDGVAIDLDRAERYLKPAAAEGYVAAFALLAKIEFKRKHYYMGAKLYVHCVVETIRLGLRDPQDQKFYALKNEKSQKRDLVLAHKMSQQ
jgi:TPR repeat protein